ncbi:hypothetical protein [Arthrobacter sp. MA-N2]|nr:hypothetical protein [Arthrobacter sp. MA-N2]
MPSTAERLSGKSLKRAIPAQETLHQFLIVGTWLQDHVGEAF